jgi:hypothetical protein
MISSGAYADVVIAQTYLDKTCVDVRCSEMQQLLLGILQTSSKHLVKHV